MDSKMLLTCALDIGEKMLISGAEISRVEDSVKRICNAYDVKRIDVFTITSSMVATLEDKDGNSITETRRITKHHTDLTKLQYNSYQCRSNSVQKGSSEKDCKRSGYQGTYGTLYREVVFLGAFFYLIYLIADIVNIGDSSYYFP